jgi:hypothetical protein
MKLSSSTGFSPPAGRLGLCALFPRSKSISGTRKHTSPRRAAQRNGERGAGYLKPILWTLILVSFVYVTFKVVPILISEYQFQDGLQTVARFASVNRQPPDKVRDAVMKEAASDDVPIQPDDIKIEGTAGNVRISVDYSVTVDLSVYQWTLNFHPSVSNSALF